MENGVEFLTANNAYELFYKLLTGWWPQQRDRTERDKFMSSVLDRDSLST